MKHLTQALLKKVKESISLRNTHTEEYTDSFRQAETFITATIKGQLEFIPMQLLFIRNNKYQILMEIKAVFGTGIEHAQLDDMLIKFYNDHNLKRDIESISDSVTYHVKPLTSAQTFDSGPLDWDKIESLSAYAGEAYRASDEQLKLIGHDFGDFIMQPTNQWAEGIVIDDLIMERERYWQVAGHYKAFTWAKIKHNKHTDKHVFF